MMVWKGLSQAEASVLLAGFAIINLPIHFLLGWIADFVNKPKLVTICLLFGVVAVLPMLWSDSLWALWFFTALYSVLDASIPGFLGVGGRLLRPQILRRHPRQYESLLHLGQPSSARSSPAPSTIAPKATRWSSTVSRSRCSSPRR